MQELEQLEQVKPPPRNTKSRRWCFTYNNWNEKGVQLLRDFFTGTNAQYFWGYEIGENGTPHLQGCFKYDNPRSFNKLKKDLPLNIHLEQCKNWLATINYCSKDGNTETNMTKKMNLKEKILEKKYKNVTWKNWQKELLGLIEQQPNPRKIYWYWEKNGNVGKSYLCKYIALKFDCIMCTGKTQDIFYQLNQWRIKNPDEEQLPICIIDNPRSEFSHINYAALEELKNGFLYSGKYEGGQVFGLEPHIIIFANSEPDYHKLSEDRLIVKNISDINTQTPHSGLAASRASADDSHYEPPLPEGARGPGRGGSNSVALPTDQRSNNLE